MASEKRRSLAAVIAHEFRRVDVRREPQRKNLTPPPPSGRRRYHAHTRWRRHRWPCRIRSALRTGAASGLAANLLARSDASAVAMLGAEAQGLGVTVPL
jgi:hypothetical protein